MENKVTAIIDILKQRYQDAPCALHYKKDYELMISVRLAAQCTDARVNLITPALFAAYPTLEAMADAPIERIEELVRSCGLYRTKAANIKDACIMLRDEYGGVLPSDMDELLRFPGVGRKIANLLRGDIYHLPAVVADTHCIRIGGRLGFYPESLKDPHKVEAILSEILAPEEQSDFCHRIVWFGREVCTARAPRCADCPLKTLCKKGSAGE